MVSLSHNKTKVNTAMNISTTAIIKRNILIHLTIFVNIHTDTIIIKTNTIVIVEE